MRRSGSSKAPPAERNVARTQRGDWATIRTLLPYLWEYKGRVVATVLCLVLAKAANVGELLSMIGTGTRHVEPERWSGRNPLAKAMTWIAYEMVRVAMGSCATA